MQTRRALEGGAGAAAILACEKSRQWKKALLLFRQMCHADVTRDVISYNAIISACGKEGWWGEALSLLGQMREALIEMDVTTYSTVISACDKIRQWEEALSLLEQMRDAGIKPNLVAYNAAILACEKSRQCGSGAERSRYSRRCRAGTFGRRSSPTYSAVISACRKSGQWEKALYWFRKILERGIPLDVITYTSVIQACSSTGQPVEALEIFDKALEQVKVDRALYNAILDAVCTSHPAKARELYHGGRGLYGIIESTKHGVPMLDLRKHSEGAGETAVRWWFENQRQAMPSEPGQLLITTGRNKSVKRMERLLTELRVRILSANNEGRHILDMQAESINS